MGGEDTAARIDTLATLPGVAQASPHYIGGVAPMLLPEPGNDGDFVTASGFTDYAKHLELIRAEHAWDYDNIETPVRIGIIDNGFDIQNPELADNIEGLYVVSSGTNANETLKQSPEDITPEEMAGSEERVACIHGTEEECDFWNTCLGEGSTGHGTAVAAIGFAEGNNPRVGDYANVVGTVWGAPLHLASYNYATYEGEKAYSSFGARVVVDAMALNDVRVINMSFGFVSFCQDGTALPVEYRKRKKDEADQWHRLIDRNPNVLFVQASGNDGSDCSDDLDPRCTAQASGLACGVVDPAASRRVLCVAASTMSETAPFQMWGETQGGGRPSGGSSNGPGDHRRRRQEFDPGWWNLRCRSAVRCRRGVLAGYQLRAFTGVPS